MTAILSNDGPDAVASAITSSLGALRDETTGQAHVGDTSNGGAEVTTSDVATTAGEQVATEVTSSDIPCPVPQAPVEQTPKPSNLDGAARKARALAKAQRKRDSDAFWEDHTPARWFDDEIAAQAKKIARAEAKKAAKLKAH